MEYLNVIPAVIFFSLLVLEYCYGHYSQQKANHNEKLVAWISYIQQFALVRPVIAFILAAVLAAINPSWENSLQQLPFWPVFFVYLLTRELIQYWYHRFSHQWPWLWQLHKTHHSAEQMNVLVTSRGNLFWFLLMPTLYFEAAMIYCGLAGPYLLAFAILAAVSISSHSGLRWDLPLFQHPLTAPIMNMLKYLITTPDTHHAHHGMGPKSNPNGNYAPLFFFYDVIFGSAKMPQQRQSQLGIPEGNAPWYKQLYSPRG